MWSSERARRRALIGGAALLLAGCGFELRRAPQMAFRTIALTGFAPRSPLAEELRQALSHQVAVVTSPADVDVVLQALADSRERSVVAQTSAAQVREIQLRVKLQFRAHRPDGRELVPASLLLAARDMSFNETQALAKSQEEAELFREMQKDIVLQVMRRLASVRV